MPAKASSIVITVRYFLMPSVILNILLPPMKNISLIGLLSGIIFLLKPQCNGDRPDHYRPSHQRPDHSRKRRTGVDTEDGYGHRYRQFKIVTRCREGQGSCLGVIRAQLFSHVKRDQKHHYTINQKPDR